MTQVTSQDELAAALTALEADIIVAASFAITTTLTINYSTSIRSLGSDVYTLTKDETLGGAIFSLNGTSASITLSNIILDGAKQLHPTPISFSSLIVAEVGTIILEDGAVLQNNRANYGGAIYTGNRANPQSTIRMRGNATIRDNEAMYDGGGIMYGAYQGVFEIGGDSIIESNTAKNGGGICYDDFVNSKLSILNINGNAKITGNTADDGGGIKVLHGDIHITNNAIIYGNIATKGGGISFNGNSIQIDNNVQIDSNSATQIGGGLLCESNENADIKIHCLIQNNTASESSGAVVKNLNSGTIDFSQARFIKNISSSWQSNGGGLLILHDSTTVVNVPILMDGTVFEGNFAKNYGAGLSIKYTSPSIFDLNINNCRFENNSIASDGGGLYIAATGNSSIIIQNSLFKDNIGNYGGGCTITHDNQDQTHVILQNDEFDGNTAGIGGALYLYKGNFYALISNVLMSNNDTTQSGGAFYNSEGSGSVTIDSNSRFIGNSSGAGGAIYSSTARQLTIADASFNQNEANDGKDIFSTNYSIQIGPNVSIPSGYGIYAVSSAPTIIRTLSTTSVIQLEGNYYIEPNPQGTPIIVATSVLNITPTDLAAFRLPDTMRGWSAQVDETQRRIVLAPENYVLDYRNTLGAENPNPTSYTVLSPPVTLLNLPDLSDYKFVGWYDSLEGGNRIYEIPQGSIGNREIYAHWRDAIHSITYYGNDDGGPPAENVPDPQSVNDGSSIILSDASPTRENYIFTHWNTSPDNTGTSYRPQDAIFDVLADINLYAQWQYVPPTEHVLAYHPNDDATSPAHGLPENSTVLDGNDIIISPLIPTRDRFIFNSWNTNQSGDGTLYNPGDIIANVRANIDLYAQWVASPYYKVTFRANDDVATPAGGIPDPITVIEGGSIIIPSSIPTRFGFRFVDWNTRPDGTGIAYVPGSVLTSVMSDIQLYAQWEFIKPQYYKISFIPNDCCSSRAYCMPCCLKSDSTQSVRIPCCCPFRIGYRFIGWNTNRHGYGKSYYPDQLMHGMDRDICLYAQWKS